jgi:uncharacterized protein (TIGR02217 family)
MIEIRFPVELSRGAMGGDTFDTQIAPLPNGNEKRNARRSVTLGAWSVAFNNRDKTKFQELRNFFLAMGGAFESFRFKDWQDYESDTEQDCSPATGDGANLVFQLQKSYAISSPATAYVRTVTKPVSGSLSVYVNGALKVEGANPGGDYTVNYATGVVTFNTGKAPPNTHTVKATYEFDKVVRFAMDERESQIVSHNVYTWDQIQLQEVPE